MNLLPVTRRTFLPGVRKKLLSGHELSTGSFDRLDWHKSPVSQRTLTGRWTSTSGQGLQPTVNRTGFLTTADANTRHRTRIWFFMRTHSSLSPGVVSKIPGGCMYAPDPHHRQNRSCHCRVAAIIAFESILFGTSISLATFFFRTDMPRLELFRVSRQMVSQNQPLLDARSSRADLLPRLPQLQQPLS